MKIITIYNNENSIQPTMKIHTVYFNFFEFIHFKVVTANVIFCLKINLILKTSLDEFLFFDQVFEGLIFWENYLIGGSSDL